MGYALTSAKESNSNPQKHAYAGLQKSLQQEWPFAQCVTPGISEAFRLVEEALQRAFLPALFHGVEKDNPRWGVTRLSVKQTGLALPDLPQSAPENWMTSCVITGHLVAALQGRTEFWTPCS